MDAMRDEEYDSMPHPTAVCGSGGGRGEGEPALAPCLVQLRGHARIRYVGKSQSCMVCSLTLLSTARDPLKLSTLSRPSADKGERSVIEAHELRSSPIVGADNQADSARREPTNRDLTGRSPPVVGRGNCRAQLQQGGRQGGRLEDSQS